VVEETLIEKMNEDQKAELRKSFASKAVSEMNKEERQVFDEDFQYGLSTNSKPEPFGGALFDFGKQIAKFMK